MENDKFKEIAMQAKDSIIKLVENEDDMFTFALFSTNQLAAVTLHNASPADIAKSLINGARQNPVMSDIIKALVIFLGIDKLNIASEEEDQFSEKVYIPKVTSSKDLN